MAPVMIWPRILAVTSGLLYKYKLNFNNKKQQKIIAYERGTNYHIWRISVFPDFYNFHISESVAILEI